MRRVGMTAWVGLMAWSSLGSAVATCLPPDSGARMRSAEPSEFAAGLRTIPAPVPVGAAFVVQFHVCATNGATIERIAVEARMPAHRHGMNYTPDMAAVGAGRYEARGLLFHMPGWWEITLSVYSSDRPSRFVLRLDVP